MAQRIQQGSILGFVLVGALLTALVIGGIFVVRHQLAKTNNDTQNPGSSQVATTGQSDQKNGSSNGTSKSSDELKKALEQQQAEEKKAQEQKAASEAQSSANQSATGSATTPSAATNLPTTGPADTLGMLLGAVLLAGVSAAYVRSRSLI